MSEISISQNIQFIINGFIIVMLVLSLLSFLCYIIGTLFIKFEKQNPQTCNNAQAIQSNEVTPEVVAVVAAAVNIIIKQPCRVLEIKSADQTSKK